MPSQSDSCNNRPPKQNQLNPEDEISLEVLALGYLESYSVLEYWLNEAWNNPDDERQAEHIQTYHSFKKEEFDTDPFERTLNDRHGDQLKEIFRLLTETHGSRFKPNPQKIPIGLDVLTDERHFELIILYIIAAAIVAYRNPDNYSHDGEDAGALQQVYPDVRVKQASRKLLKAIWEQGLLLPAEMTINLIELGNGSPVTRQLEPSPKALSRMGKEISLISKRRLIMRTKARGGRGRFPAEAIVIISRIMEHKPIPTPSTIRKIQREFVDCSESPLSDNFDDIP